MVPSPGPCEEQEEPFPQLDGPAAIVLGELVLIKLRKRRCQSLLDLARERYTPVLPVDSDKLGELVGTLDDTRKRLRNRRTVSLLARHLADKQERCMTQLHLLTSLDGKRGHLLGRDLRY